MLGYFIGGTNKIPPHNLSFTAIPKDPLIIQCTYTFYEKVKTDRSIYRHIGF